MVRKSPFRKEEKVTKDQRLQAARIIPALAGGLGIVVLGLVSGVEFAVAGNDTSQIDRAVSKAVGFLQGNQLRHGEFKTYVSPDSTMRRILHFDSSPFVTTFVIYSLDFVEDPRVDDMTRRALDFLQSEEERSGIWRYWTSLNDKRIDPDLDDTSCISFLLRKHGRRFGGNQETIYRNRNSEGLFYTWIRDPYSTEPNDVDCVVNTNVLLYLGENANTRAACLYVNDVINRHAELENSVYYIDKSAVYYCVSRAIREGVRCLAASRDSIICRTLRSQNPDGSWGDELATAFSLCTLLNSDAADSSVMDLGISFLLKRQQFTGSWTSSAFYIARDASVWWGSEELTTAICIEALVRYRAWSLRHQIEEGAQGE
jgi:hypothetical protein